MRRLMGANAGSGNQSDEFNAYAKNYEKALDKGLSLTGESKTYYAEGRILWLKRCLSRLGFAPKSVLDFGCGTGGSIPYFFRYLGVESAVGLDPSKRSLEVGRATWGKLNARFRRPEEHDATGSTDLAFCNGVFHHIVPAERAAAASLVFEDLRPGGVFAFWENNPWNPMTRFVMKRIPFDEDAILVWPATARKLLRESGFEIVSTRFLFVFPGALSWLRWMEPFLSRLPLGGQYQVLCRKRGKRGE